MHKERKILKKVSQLDISCHVNILVLSMNCSVISIMSICPSNYALVTLSLPLCHRVFVESKKNPFLEQQSKTTLSQFDIRTLQLSFIEQNREELSFPFPDDHIKSIL